MTSLPLYLLVVLLAAGAVLLIAAFVSLERDQSNRPSARVRTRSRRLFASGLIVGGVVPCLLAGIPGVIPWWNYAETYTRLPLLLGVVGLVVSIALLVVKVRDKEPPSPQDYW
ncbi:MAG: hypothetical protein HYY93_05945 [Planctomycetes bacterium]|nr:hypothetical protein [Planctomycetota bacterium]